MDGWKDYEGKKVFVKLRNNREYSGIILSVVDKGDFSIIKLKDKFGNLVGFYDSEISVMEEQGKKVDKVVEKVVDKEVDNAS